MGEAKRGTLRGPAQGSRSATFAPLKKISTDTTASRGQYAARFFGRQPRRGSFQEAAYEAKQVVDGDAEAPCGAPIEHDPEV